MSDYPTTTPRDSSNVTVGEGGDTDATRVPSHGHYPDQFVGQMRPADTSRHADGHRFTPPPYEAIPAMPTWQDQPAPNIAKNAGAPGIEAQESMTVRPMGADDGDWDDGPWSGISGS